MTQPPPPSRTARKPARRAPSSFDVARRAGVSRATVSYVFNGRRNGVPVAEETRRRVLDAAEALGYQPNRTAQALKTGRTQAVALWSELTTPYYAMLLRRLQERIAADGYEMVVTGARPAEGFDLGRWPVDGILAVDRGRELDAFLESTALRPPVVSMGVYYSRRVDCAAVDLYRATWDAMAHLEERGKREAAFVAPAGYARDFQTPDADGADPRIAAYCAFQRARGRHPGVVYLPQRGRTEARETVRSLVRGAGRSHPDAFLCLDDDIAIGTMRGLRDAGLRVPEDAAAIGCDGIEDGEYQEPALTTIVQPVEEAAAAAWELLQRRLREPDSPLKHVSLPARLEVRGSS